MTGRVQLLRLSPTEYSMSATHYVGNIVLPNHYIVIRPKVRVNFFRMLYFTPDLLPEFSRFHFQYEKEEDIYEVIIGRFLDEIERIVKQGISKGYEEIEENLTAVKQRILLLQNVRANSIVRDRVFCRFSELTSDIPENRVIKFALYQVSQMPLRNSNLLKRARYLVRYLEQVKLTRMSAATFPQVQFNRLNEHYRIVVNLAKLVIEHCTLNLQTDGEVRYASYLVDMNVLFQRFLCAYLRNNLIGYSVKEEPVYDWDEEGRFELIPDIVVRKSGHDILAIDAKWKRRLGEEEQFRTVTGDLKQMYLYCDRLGLSVGVLVYPKHELSPGDERPINVTKQITILTMTVDLNKENEQFEQVCNEFVSEVTHVLEGIQHSREVRWNRDTD